MKIKFIPLPEDVTLEIDLLRMNSVIINLLTNALKFSKASDVITIKIKI